MRIMIVDDNKRMRSMLRSALSTLDDTVVELDDGADALEQFVDYRPDLVLMDVVMKFMDGITATRLLTQNYPASRIIIVSQYDDAALRRKAVEAGAVGYFLKDRLDEILVFINSERGTV